MSSFIETEVLIIGCGIAGGTAALKLADAGIPVTVVTRAQQPEQSNTFLAQGGIIFRGTKDSPGLLMKDLTRAGAGYNNPKSVAILAEEGPGLVEEFLVNKLGVQFDKTENGELAIIREAAHTTPRILHATDETGRAIETAIIKALQERPEVTILTGHTAIDLLTSSHHSYNSLTIYDPCLCFGAYLLKQDSQKVFRCLAKTTILATGGLGQIFLRTSNPPGARGDGLAMAHRAGARVINCEFIQFHPTTFHLPNAPHFLISEAVRGAGARLVLADGKPFMQKHAPKWKDLAPRDIVARSIHREMVENGLSNAYIDLHNYISNGDIKERFPTIHQQCLEYGVDISCDLVPVVPGAHYSCGGVWTDQHGQTTIERLYAVGEVACTGLHGANRLGSASLLEGLVWGARAAWRIITNLPELAQHDANDIPPWQSSGSTKPDPVLINQDMSSIKNIMWNYVGLMRTTARLERALRELHNLETEIERFYRVMRLTDALIGLRNAVRSAVVVSAAAWSNKKSVGCHYRE